MRGLGALVSFLARARRIGRGDRAQSWACLAIAIVGCDGRVAARGARDAVPAADGTVDAAALADAAVVSGAGGSGGSSGADGAAGAPGPLTLSLIEDDGPAHPGLASTHRTRVLAVAPSTRIPDSPGPLVNGCSADLFDRARMDLPPRPADLGALTVTRSGDALACVLDPVAGDYACGDPGAAPFLRPGAVAGLAAAGGPDSGALSLTVPMPSSGISVVSPVIDGVIGAGVIDVSSPMGVEIQLRCPDASGAPSACRPIVGVELVASDGLNPPRQWAIVTCTKLNPEIVDATSMTYRLHVPYEAGSGAATRPVAKIFESFPWRVLRTRVTHHGAPDQVLSTTTVEGAFARTGYVTLPVTACPIEQAVNPRSLQPAACAAGEKCDIAGYIEASGLPDPVTGIPGACIDNGVNGGIGGTCEHRFGCLPAGSKGPGEVCTLDAFTYLNDCRAGSTCAALDGAGQTLACVELCPAMNGDASCAHLATEHVPPMAPTGTHCFRGGFFRGTNLSACTLPCDLGDGSCPAPGTGCKILIGQQEFLCWGVGDLPVGTSCQGLGTSACGPEASCARDAADDPSSPAVCRADCSDRRPCAPGFTCRAISGMRSGGGTCQPT